MDISYKRQHNESFMVVELEDTVSTYEEKMIEENQISSLLTITRLNFNGCMQYHYNISRKENLEDFLDSHDLNLDTFRRFVVNLKLAYAELDKYLIDERHIWLDKESVFFEKGADSFKLSLCFYPKDMGTMQEQFRTIMDYILKKVPSSDREFSRIIYEIYDLCLKEDYTLGEILEYLQPKESEVDTKVESINLRDDFPAETTEELRADDYPLGQEFVSDLTSFQVPEKPSIFGKFISGAKGFLTKKIEFKDEYPEESEDFIIEPDAEFEEKTVLLSETKPVGRLVYDGQDGENDFLVTKDIFRIGKSKSCDAVISAPTISQNHAKIVREGDDYFLSDMNSTNSTFLNNEELVYRRPVKLKIMDKIRFANVSYTFM